MLVRGEIHVIGAATLNECRQYIEKDGALERRFQKIIVHEPSVRRYDYDSSWLKGTLRNPSWCYDSRPCFGFCCGIIQSLYYRRYLPDKAIDLVDEACATIRVQMDSVPTELDELSRKIMRLEIEKEAIRKEKMIFLRNVLLKSIRN